jgi:hypothetical protein
MGDAGHGNRLASHSPEHEAAFAGGFHNPRAIRQRVMRGGFAHLMHQVRNLFRPMCRRARDAQRPQRQSTAAAPRCVEVVQKAFRCHKVSTLEAFTEAAVDLGEDCPRVITPSFWAQ